MELESIARRLILYVVWGAGFFLLFEQLFTLSEPLPGVISLLLVLGGLAKDAYDEFYLDRDPALYDYVEHNSMNILLLWGLGTGRYDIGVSALGTAVLFLALTDFIFDGIQDGLIEAEFS